LDIVLCWPSWIDEVEDGQHNAMSNVDVVNPRRPTQFNVQRRRRHSKKAKTIQCPTQTPSIQEGQHNTRPTQCKANTIHIILAFLDGQRLRWTMHCVGHLGLTVSPLDIVLCCPTQTPSIQEGQHNKRPTQYNVQRRRRQSKKANTIQCPTQTLSIQEGQHNTMPNAGAVNPRRPTQYKANTMQCSAQTPSIQESQHCLGLALCWPSWNDGVSIRHCIVLAFLD
jgi:hypothetical protein